MTNKAKIAVMKLARAQHKWAVKILKDKKWMANASEMSSDMAHRYASSTVEELAERAYAYSKMRYDLAEHSGFHCAFKWDVDVWESIQKGIHPNTKVFTKKI